MHRFCTGYQRIGSAAAAVLSSLPPGNLVSGLRQHARRAASACRRYYRLSSLQYHACGAYNHCRLILDGAYIFLPSESVCAFIREGLPSAISCCAPCWLTMCCAILYPQCVLYKFLRICRFFVSVFIFSAFAVRRTAFCFSVPYRFDRSGALLFLPETSAR